MNTKTLILLVLRIIGVAMIGFAAIAHWHVSGSGGSVDVEASSRFCYGGLCLWFTCSLIDGKCG